MGRLYSTLSDHSVEGQEWFSLTIEQNGMGLLPECAVGYIAVGSSESKGESPLDPKRNDLYGIRLFSLGVTMRSPRGLLIHLVFRAMMGLGYDGASVHCGI